MSPSKLFWYVLATCCVVLTGAITWRILTEPRGYWEVRADGTIFNATTGEWKPGRPKVPRVDARTLPESERQRLKSKVESMYNSGASDSEIEGYLYNVEGVQPIEADPLEKLWAMAHGRSYPLTHDDAEFQKWKREKAFRKPAQNLHQDTSRK